MTESRSQAGGGPTVQRMLVGARLRRLRTELGLTRDEAAQAIRASEWKIHRLENGQVGFKDRDIIDLLARYQVTDPAEVADFLTLARKPTPPAGGNTTATCSPAGSAPMSTWNRPPP